MSANTAARRLRPGMFWPLPYGWRVGEPSFPRYGSAADVVRYEREELGNVLDVPPFMMEALAHVPAIHLLWVCRSRAHAWRYGGEGRGQPYQEETGEGTLILATDQEDETGYLLLIDATTLIEPAVLPQFLMGNW